MAYDLPDDLITLKRDWLTADARCEEIASRLPSSVAVVALEAERDEQALTELREARAERLRLTEEINRHPWWATTENRHDAWMALNRAAKEASGS